MLAARMYDKNDLRLEDIPVPRIKPGEILLKVKAAAICGTDIRMLTNGAKGISPDNPIVLGHELAGVIETVGENVTTYKAGQRVAIAPNIGCGICAQCVAGNGHLCPEYKALGISLDGGFAEYCIIPEMAVRSGNICLLDDKISFVEAAVNEPFSCVYNGFEHADIHPGDNVMIVGAGPIGIMHCAISIMAGATVYLNDVNIERLEKAKSIYPGINTINGDIKNNVFELTSGLGMDVVITACPVPSVQSMAIELAAIGGRVIFFGGVPASEGYVPINSNQIHYKQLIVSGTTRASITQYRKTLRFISSGVLDVKPLVSKTLPLENIAEGIELAKKGIGFKNVIVMD